MSTRIYFSILFLSGILFLIFYLILSYHNRLAADDFYYLGCVPENGAWYCMKDLYNNYSARWSAYLFTGIIISFYKSHHILFFFNLITLSVLITLIFNILKLVLETSGAIVPRKLIFVYTLILVSALFFTSFSIGETWFWTVQVTSYLWSIIMFLLLFLTLLKKEFNFLQFILILVSSAYIGGASESYSLIFISLMLMMFYALSKEENFKSIFSKRAKLKMGLALMFLLISLAITLSAPGNEIRLNALPSPPLTERLIIPFKSFAKLFLFKILPVLPYLIIFTSPWIILGNYFSRFNISNYSVNRYTIPFLFFIFIAILPTSIVMSETGPDRALSIISFSIVLFLSFQFYNFGYSKVTSSKYLNLIRIISAPAIFIIIAANTFTRGNLAAQYSKAYDERIAYLLAQKENTIDLVVVPSLPASGYLYSAEVSADPNHFTNRFLVDAYNLNFKLSLKENE